jgi:WD40 repeat protein
MRYKAFISYSHAADGKLAPAIQRALHRIAKPWYRLRTMRVFRDQTSLSTSPGLWTSIESALNDAEFFVYLASPTAAQSTWVQKEVAWWLKNRSYQSFLIVLTGGELAWDDAQQDLNWTTTTAMPRQVSKAFAEEPLYVDLRWARNVDQLSIRHAQFRAALLDLAATLLNRPKDELDGDDVRQYRRTRRIAWSGAVTLAALFVAALLAAYFATQQSMLATARALSAQSEAVLPTNPELALLLAREALKYKIDDQAEYALRLAFVRNPQRTIHHSPIGRTFFAKFVGSKFVVAAERGKAASVWDVVTGQRLAELGTEVGDEELILGESSDHSVVAIPAPDDSTFTLYDTKTWKALPALPGAHLRISGDGSVLTAVQDDKIRQWILPSLEERNVKARLPEGYEIRDLSRDGSLLLLVTNSELSDGLILHAISGEILAKIPESVFRTGSALSPDGRFVVAQRKDANVFELRNAQSGSLVRAFEEGFDLNWITYVAFSPDSKMFVAGDREGSLQRWDVETGKQVRMLSSQRRYGNYVYSIKFSPDSKAMLTASADRTACLWDTQIMRCIVSLGGRGDEAFDTAFAADSRHFLTAHTDGTVRVWDRQTWEPVQSFPAANTVVSDDGQFVLSATETGMVSVWNAAEGQVKATIQHSGGDIHCLALSPSKSLVAIAPAEGVVELWNSQNGAAITKLDASSAATTAMAFDSKGTQLATGSNNGTVRFWSTTDGKLVGEWQATENEVHRIMFHPDEERVVISGDGWARVRNRKSGAILSETQLDQEGDVEGLSLNADGSLLLVTGDVFPQVWDLNSYKRVQTLKGHVDEVYSGAFSRDGQWLVTGSGYRHAAMPPEDGDAVFLWDAKTGRQLFTYRSAGWSVDTIAFANDGRVIFAFAGGGDGTLRQYECDACLPLPELLQLVSAKTSRELSAEERARYVSEGTLLSWLMNVLLLCGL